MVVRRIHLSALALVLLAFAAAATRGGGRWRVYKECRLAENPANDGDSFHVLTAKHEYLFRLYFVDCPESDRLVPGRVKEQAAHFGVSEEAVLKAGELALQFTHQFLAGGFIVQTRKEDARGQSRMKRYYAIVKAGDKDLAEELVMRGLARAYGKGTELPDGSEEDLWRAELASAERNARTLRLGLWRDSRAQAAPRAAGGH